jgi:hypothetical protein
MGWLSDWSKRVEITIDNTNIDSDLTHFPVPILLGTSVGQDSDDVSFVFDELTSDANRKKIAVTKSDGTTEIYVEIEFWDDANEKALLWVSKSDLTISSGSTTTLYLYYDSTKPENTTYVGDTTDAAAQAVWDSDYAAVWHMAQDPDGGTADAIKDSTSNGVHGTSHSSMNSADLVDSDLGKGIEFDGGDDCISVNDAALNITDVITVEAFAEANSKGGGGYGRLYQNDAGSSGNVEMYINDNDGDFVTRINGSPNPEVTNPTGWALGEFQCYFSRYDSVADQVVRGQVNLDTAESGSYSTAINAENDSYIGNWSDGGGRGWDGIIDEVRVSNAFRSAAWLKADYYAFNDDLVSFGTEETSGLVGVFCLNLSILDGLNGVLNIMSPLGTGGILDLITSLPVYGEQALRNKMSDDLLQALRLCASGDTGILNLLAGMGISRAQALLSQLGTSAAGAQALRNLISADPAAAAQILRLVIDENNRIHGEQNLRLALKDLAAQFPDISCAISIDGKPVRHRIISASVTYSQDSAHNAIMIVSSDFDLYSLADPDILRGEQRIELQVGTRVLYFMIEERSGDPRQWSIWGRSLSAREDVPHATESAYTQDEPESASAVAEDLLTVCALDWTAPDWVLPDTFEFFGSPIEGVRQIASAIGAVVRSQDDGSIEVRRRYPVRPIDLPTASPDVTYSSETEVIEVGFRRVTGSRYNAVQVNGYSPEVFLPDLEVEETSPIQGTDVHVRAYWAGQIPAAPPTVYVTAGAVTKLADGTAAQTERVIFSGGVGELSYPPEDVSSVLWIGANGGAVSWEKHVKTLGISTTEPRLATVTYTTQFSRYRIYDHNVSELVFTMVVSPGRDASVRVRMGAGDREALAINEPLLTSAGICVERGRAFLDDSRYDAIEIDIVAPYEDEAVDGAVICLEQDDLHITGNALIFAAGIEIEGPRITNRLRVRKWQVS